MQQLSPQEQLACLRRKLALLNELALVDMGVSHRDPTYDPDGEAMWKTFSAEQKIHARIKELEEQLKSAESTTNS